MNKENNPMEICLNCSENECGINEELCGYCMTQAMAGAE